MIKKNYWHIIIIPCGIEWLANNMFFFFLSLFNCFLIPILLVFLLCSLFVTLPPVVFFSFRIHSFQTKPLLRSLDQRKWRWPAAAVEEASLACPAVLPVLSAYPSAVQLYGRRRAAGPGPLSPAVGVPPVSVSWAKATRTPPSLPKMVRTQMLAYSFLNNLNIYSCPLFSHKLQLSQSLAEQVTSCDMKRDSHLVAQFTRRTILDWADNINYIPQTLSSAI